MRITRPIVAAASAALLVVGLNGVASAQSAPTRAVAYVNPDAGAATANPDVEANSSCATPDTNDTQAVGDPATGTGNVHVDACLFAGASPLDTRASFDVIGPAVVSGCPDPDKEAMAKSSTKTDARCTLSGFEDANKEYHVRVVGTSAGIAQVVFCGDPESNGCADASVKETVIITFQGESAPVAAPASSAQSGAATPAATPAAAIPVGAVAAGEAPETRTGPLLPAVAAGLIALAGSLAWNRRPARI